MLRNFEQTGILTAQWKISKYPLRKWNTVTANTRGKRVAFLEKMDEIIPGKELTAVIEPQYHPQQHIGPTTALA
jgi:hypothetical protein